MGNAKNVIAALAQGYYAPMQSNGNAQPNPVFQGPSTTLTTALTETATTALEVAALPLAVAAGDSITLTSGSNTQTVTASAAAAVNATSITVTSFTPNFAYPVGTTVQDTATQSAIPQTVVWPSVWTAFGFTEEGIKESTEPKTVDYNVEEQPTPVGVGVDTTDIEFTTTMAEDTLANQLLAMGNGGTLTSISGTYTGTTFTLGDSLTPLSIAFQTINPAGLWRVWYCPKAVVTGKVEISYRRAKAYRMLPLTIRALCDPTLITTTDRDT